MKYLAVLAAALVAVPVAAQAQGANALISAQDPAALAEAMELGGYPVEMTTDSFGDPLIRTEYSGWRGSVVFYGCDEESHEGCDSIQLSVAFDRATPMPPELVNELLSTERFISIHLDDEGDPWVTWDILTANGIPRAVLMRALLLFSQQTETVSERVFAEENGG